MTPGVKQPLHPNGGTPLGEADMPLSELQSVYEPDLLDPRPDLLDTSPEAQRTAIELRPSPAIAQNGQHTKTD